MCVLSHGWFNFFSIPFAARQQICCQAAFFCSRFWGAQLLSVLISVHIWDQMEGETEREHREQGGSLRPWAGGWNPWGTWTCPSNSLLNTCKIQKKKIIIVIAIVTAVAASWQAVTGRLHPLQRTVANICVGAQGGMRSYPGGCPLFFYCLVLDVLWRTFRSIVCWWQLQKTKKFVTHFNDRRKKKKVGWELRVIESPFWLRRTISVRWSSPSLDSEAPFSFAALWLPAASSQLGAAHCMRSGWCRG